MVPPRSDPPPRPRQTAQDEEALEQISSASAWLPEPLAALVLELEVARDAMDATGARKRAFEFGIGIVRYAVSVGLAELTNALHGASAPDPVAQPLRRAYRLTDGKWCELLRVVAGTLERLGAPGASCFRFSTGRELQALVAARNRFIHEGGDGADAFTCALRLAEAAKTLLQKEVRLVASGEPSLVEVRAGIPRRVGVWRKIPFEVPPHAAQAEAYLGEDWIRLSPWLPLVDGSLRLLDSPASPDKPWRIVLPETGEHRVCTTTDAAIRRLAGDDVSAPRAPTDRPALVGREVVLSLVRRASREALDGGVRVLVLDGPQGAGHSRIVSEVANAAPALGFERAISVFGSRDRRAPLSALRLALGEVADAPELQAVLSAVQRAQNGDALADRAHVDSAIEAVEELLVAAARERPTLLAVDDADWLDEHSLSLLRLLTERATRGATGRLFVLAAVKHGRASSIGLRLWIEQVDRDVGSGATRVSLEPLETGYSKLLVQGVAPVASEVESVLVRESAGLPFYMVQPLLVWIETAELEWREGAWRPRGVPTDAIERAAYRDVLQTAIPGTRQLVQARLAALFAEGSEGERAARQLLGATALHASPLPMKRLLTVVAANGFSPPMVESVLHSLFEASLLEVGDGTTVKFAQPMIARAVTEAERSQGWWEALHRTLLADMLSDPATDPVALADGFEALRDSANATLWRWQALSRRMLQGAFEEARAIAEMLASTSADPDERVRAELAAVDALQRAGDVMAAQKRFDAVFVGEQVSMRTRVAWRISATSLSLAARRPLVDGDALLSAADAHGDIRDAVQSRLLLASHLRGSRGRALIVEALSRAESEAGVGDLRYRLLALDFELLYELRTGTIDDLRAAAERARTAARELGSKWAELDALNDAAVLEADAGRLSKALADLDQVAEGARQSGLGSIRRTALVNASTLALRDANPGAARDLARIAVTEARDAGETRQLATALSVLSEAEHQSGNAAAARLAVDESISLREGWADPGLAIALLRRAEMLSPVDDDGAVHDAKRALEHAIAIDNTDLQARARLWLAMREVAGGTVGAREALTELVNSMRSMTESLKPATLERLERARSLVDSTGG